MPVRSSRSKAHAVIAALAIELHDASRAKRGARATSAYLKCKVREMERTIREMDRVNKALVDLCMQNDIAFIDRVNAAAHPRRTIKVKRRPITETEVV